MFYLIICMCGFIEIMVLFCFKHGINVFTTTPYFYFYILSGVNYKRFVPQDGRFISLVAAGKGDSK